MMKTKHNQSTSIWIHSDQHLDVRAHYLHSDVEAIDFTPPDETDLIIVAGDTMEGVDGIDWVDKFGKPAVYVAGNHEYYRRNIEETELALRRHAKESQHVTFLNNDRYDYKNIRILGTTLWTDYRLEHDEQQAISDANGLLMDHRVITTIAGGPRRRFFMAEDAQKVHYRSREWLERELSKPHDGPTIVVTHHAPHINSVHRMYIGTGPVNACFASDLSDILEKYDIDLWIHGHTHWTFDYEVFGTHVVCNPYGYYPSNEINDFNKNLLIEII
ncbi:metallophosphoesterase [Zhongshania sp.]|jgi:predicted phosphohydrolase|uniref:metallophosphoesterase n=1 Tax=Zhongshania sp. TaxID=1971902 RepID=UPI0039E597DF